jgi:hypothetical protein
MAAALPTMNNLMSFFTKEELAEVIVDLVTLRPNEPPSVLWKSIVNLLGRTTVVAPDDPRRSKDAHIAEARGCTPGNRGFIGETAA